MAKKSVATFRDKSAQKGLTKVIIPVKNKETGGYSFQQEMVAEDNLDQFLKEKGLK